jgi:flagellar motor switch protein FliN/FliY
MAVNVLSKGQVDTMSPKPKSVPAVPISPPPGGSPAAIERFADVSVLIEARLEERLMDFSSLRRIAPGFVLPLRRAAGDTVDVYIGNVRFASAEVVVIEDRLALRITEIEGLEA